MKLSILALIVVGGYIFYLKKTLPAEKSLLDEEQAPGSDDRNEPASGRALEKDGSKDKVINEDA